jgi:hypothetical protein
VAYAAVLLHWVEPLPHLTHPTRLKVSSFRPTHPYPARTPNVSEKRERKIDIRHTSVHADSPDGGRPHALVADRAHDKLPRNGEGQDTCVEALGSQKNIGG